MCNKCRSKRDNTNLGKEFNCVDCKVNTGEIDEYYMVYHYVWAYSHVGRNDGMLCIGCLEKRIGRQLTKRDFMEAPINDPQFFTHSDRLTNRLNTLP